VRPVLSSPPADGLDSAARRPLRVHSSLALLGRVSNSYAEAGWPPRGLRTRFARHGGLAGIVVLALGVLWACKAEDALAELPALPEGPHVPSFEQVWRTVAAKHYDPTLACLDWLALREHYGAKVAEAGSDTAAAYLAINELLGLLGQSHLHATAPIGASDPAAATTRETGPATVPIVVRWLPIATGSDERAVVIVDEAVDGHPSGLPRGAILVSVDGESITQLASQTAASVTERGGRATEAAFLVARAVGATLSCPAEGHKTITYLGPAHGPADEDAATELEVPCFLPEGDRMSLGNLRDLPTVVHARTIPDSGADPSSAGAPAIGYLAFNFWMLPMAAKIEAEVAALRAQGIAGLIIDLRGNPGGVGSMSIPIARMLVREPISLGRLQMREFNQEFKVEGDPDAFAGPVAILVDEGTASTSEIFALGLRDVGRVSIVGAGPSAGMALPSMIEQLPDGGMIQYVVGDYHSGKGTAAEGGGVVPEVLVPESRADFVAGRDPVLDAAVEHLRGQLSAPADPAPVPAPVPAPAPD
jgi:carboxyl-terminal processing protease